MKVLAKFLALRLVSNWLIAWAKRTPYLHIVKDGLTYMERYWVFNPYDNASRKTRYPKIVISARVHHIMQPDQDRDLHDHPWNARTFILHGWYKEIREDGQEILRSAGETACLRFGEYHRITEISEGGVYTLFVTGRFQGVWGFKVNGEKVPFREYLK